MNFIDIISMIPNLLFSLFFLLLFIGIIMRVYKNYFKKAVIVKAKVIDKYETSYEKSSRSEPARIITDYVVVFDINGQTVKFRTTVWIYNSVRKGDNGILKYKGNRIIEFQS